MEEKGSLTSILTSKNWTDVVTIQNVMKVPIDLTLCKPGTSDRGALIE